MAGLFDTLGDWFSGVGQTVGGAYDAASASLVNAMNSTGITPQGWSADWQQAVDNLKKKAQEFVQLFTRLEYEAKNVPASEKGAYDALMAKGRWIRDQVRTLTTGIDFGWSVFGSSSPAVLNGLGALAGRGGLGVLPLVPIAAIVGAVAVITMWLSDAYVMLRKIDAAKASGGTPDQQAAIINAGGGSSIAQVAKFGQSAVMFVLVGGVLYLFAPQIKKALKL